MDKTEKYIEAIVRLKDELLENKPSLDIKLNFSESFLYVQAALQSPLIRDIVLKVQEELECEFNEYQCSYAIGWAFQEQMPPDQQLKTLEMHEPRFKSGNDDEHIPFVEQLLPIFDGNNGWLSVDLAEKILPRRSPTWEEMGYDCWAEIVAPDGAIFVWLQKKSEAEGVDSELE